MDKDQEYHVLLPELLKLLHIEEFKGSLHNVCFWMLIPTDEEYESIRQIFGIIPKDTLTIAEFFMIMDTNPYLYTGDTEWHPGT